MEKFFECFEKIGVFISEKEKNLELLLDDYIQDSLQYINLIVTIEEVFGISLNDDVMVKSNIKTFSDLYSLINNSN
jgi:acyl carrier protein